MSSDHSDPVGQDLDRTGRLEQRPVEREEAPQDVGRDAEEQSAADVWHAPRIGGGLAVLGAA